MRKALFTVLATLLKKKNEVVREEQEQLNKGRISSKATSSFWNRINLFKLVIQFQNVKRLVN